MPYVIEKLKRSNSRKYQPFCELATIDDVIVYMQKNNVAYREGSDPYLFSYIPLSDGSIVTAYEIVGRDNAKIPVSPLGLRTHLVNLNTNEKA